MTKRRSPALPPFPHGTERGIDIEGREAIDIGARLGWIVRRPDTKPRIAGDWLVSDDHYVARVFFTPALVSNDWSRVPDGRVRVSYFLEGRGTVAFDGGPPRSFKPGDMILTDTSMSMTMESTDAVAGLYFGSIWNRFLGLGPASRVVGQPFAADEGFARVFSSLINSTLSSGIAAEDPAVPPLYRAVDSVLESCVIAETGWAILDSSSRVRQLHDAASQFIASRYHEPGLDVNGIARGLGVSVKHLQSAFRAAGETPSAVLRRARLARVRTLMSEQTNLTARDLRDIAQASGFTGTLQLRRALDAAAKRKSSQSERVIARPTISPENESPATDEDFNLMKRTS